MGNYTFIHRVKRWAKYLKNYIKEKLHGLDFSMVYVGDLQRNVDEFHGYSMTDADDMKWMLRSIPVNTAESAFLDVGCGKGMCMKCAVESGYKKVAGLDLDEHLLSIARNNMKKLKMNVDCIYTNAVEFNHYADYDVFYFYNPFGRHIFAQVIEKIKDSQLERNRDIWVAYYHPVFGGLFEKAGFAVKDELRDTTRNTKTIFYCYPKSQHLI